MTDYLQVTAHLAAPVVWSDGMPLDSIVMQAAYLDAFGPAFYGLPDPKIHYVPLPPDYPFPITKEVFGDNANWVYASSFAVGEIAVQNLEHFSKRNDLDALLKYTDKTNRLINHKGRYKDYYQPYYTKETQSKTLVWYVRSDNSELLERLLTNYLPAIGKRAHSGNGVIERWEIKEIGQDYSIWQPNGSPARSIPVRFLSGEVDAEVWNIALTGYKPPYWLRRNQEACVLPN